MKNALIMFNELGFKLCNSSKSSLLYKFATDYEEIFVRFDLVNKSYYTAYRRFIDNNEGAFVPMNERPQSAKHSCYYGHWQAQMWYSVNIKLHNAIHQQMIELWWVE